MSPCDIPKWCLLLVYPTLSLVMSFAVRLPACPQWRQARAGRPAAMLFVAAGVSRHVTALGVMCGLAICSSVMALDTVRQSAAASLSPVSGAAPQIDFDIPAQPLAAALDRYAELARRPALFRSELVAGRMSSGLHGRYTPELALQQLLQGTGLRAESSTAGPADGFVLVAAPSALSATEAVVNGQYEGIAGLVSDRQYPAVVQARIWQALCSQASTAPDSYRALLRFQLDANGRLRLVRLLQSSGNRARDAAVVKVLQALEVGTPPPDMMQQDLTMLILPAAQGGPRCQREAHSP